MLHSTLPAFNPFIASHIEKNDAKYLNNIRRKVEQQEEYEHTKF